MLGGECRRHNAGAGRFAACCIAAVPLLVLLSVGCTDATVSLGGSSADGGAISADTEGKASSPNYVNGLVSFTPGAGSGFGVDNLPGVVLGPPVGGGPGKGSFDVVSLGSGGSIVLEMSSTIRDGPGPDFLVFENAFSGWVETGSVSVSADGTTWLQFPCACDDEKGGFPGCAGVQPVLSAPGNGIDPLDPTVAGGDAFDLATIGAKSANFVRIVDSGKNSYDGKTGGFDLDAIAIVNAEP